MLCLLFFIYWEGRLRKAAKMARAAPFPFPLYYFGKEAAQSGKNGTGCAVPLFFLYFGKAAAQGGENGTGLCRAPFPLYYFGNVSLPCAVRRSAGERARR